MVDMYNQLALLATISSSVQQNSGYPLRPGSNVTPRIINSDLFIMTTFMPLVYINTHYTVISMA